MILNEALIAEARRLTGLTEKTAIVHAGLEALIARESARRLAQIGSLSCQPGSRPMALECKSLWSSTGGGGSSCVFT